MIVCANYIKVIIMNIQQNHHWPETLLNVNINININLIIIHQYSAQSSLTWDPVGCAACALRHSLETPSVLLIRYYRFNPSIRYQKKWKQAQIKVKVKVEPLCWNPQGFLWYRSQTLSMPAFKKLLKLYITIFFIQYLKDFVNKVAHTCNSAAFLSPSATRFTLILKSNTVLKYWYDTFTNNRKKRWRTENESKWKLV